MTRFWPAGLVLMEAINRLLSVGIVLMQPAIWQWATSPSRSRRGSFFGMRVPDRFTDTPPAAAIRARFVRQIWTGAAVIALVPAFVPVADVESGLTFMAVLMASEIWILIAYAGANRRTRLQAPPVAGVVREANLLEADVIPAWISLVEWMVIVAPIGLPLATAAALALRWSRLTTEARASNAQQVVLACAVALVPSISQLALRYRARSLDWAPTEPASRRYRAMLGLMGALAFAAPIGQMCALTLMSVFESVNMNRYFLWAFPLQFAGLAALVGLWRWLGRHLSRESGDPMPDSRWKWGYFYVNGDDPALVVPLRSGPGFSFNHARPSVWIVGGAITSAAAVLTAVLMSRTLQ